MPLYDERAILDEVSALEVAMDLGIKMQKRGKNYSVLCPFHNDGHFGSAVLTNKGMHCFVCNETWSITEYIMEEENISKMDALKIMGDVAGGAEKFVIKKNKNDKIKKNPNLFPLNSKQLERLGINMDGEMKSAINVSFEEISNQDVYSGKIYNKQTQLNEYLIIPKRQRYSIKDFYQEDKETCLEMLREKADEKLNYCKDMILFFNQSSNIEAIEMTSDFVEIFYEIKEIIDIIIKEQQKIKKVS